MSRCVVISGCSGGGKSTLLAALAGQGFGVVEEPGRRIVRNGGPSPWADMEGFLRRALVVAEADLAAAGQDWTFFDRGVVDAWSGLDALGPAGEVPAAALRYHRVVFLAPPWPDIYVGDAERRHGFEAAVAEYERLAEAYPVLGYRVVLLPLADVRSRVDFVLSTLGLNRS